MRLIDSTDGLTSFLWMRLIDSTDGLTSFFICDLEVSNAGFCPGGPFMCIGGSSVGHYECTKVESQACQEWIGPSLQAELVPRYS